MSNERNVDCEIILAPGIAPGRDKIEIFVGGESHSGILFDDIRKGVSLRAVLEKAITARRNKQYSANAPNVPTLQN